jgi:hypothetical protein
LRESGYVWDDSPQNRMMDRRVQPSCLGQGDPRRDWHLLFVIGWLLQVLHLSRRRGLLLSARLEFVLFNRTETSTRHLDSP